MSEEVIIEEIQTQLRRKKLFMAIIAGINVILAFLYISIPFDLPRSSNVVLTPNSLMQNYFIPLIQQGNLKGPMLTGLNSKPYTPDTEYNTWLKQNPFNLSFPSGKLQNQQSFFTVKTHNPKVQFQPNMTVDTLYPGALSFGAGVLDNIHSRILIYDKQYYFMEGISPIASFKKNLDRFKRISGYGYGLYKAGSNLVLTDRFGTERIFEPNTEHYYQLSTHRDHLNNEIEFSYDEKGLLREVSSDRGIGLSIRWNAKSYVSQIKQEENIYNFHYDDHNNLHQIENPNAKKVIYHHKNPSYPNTLTSIDIPGLQNIKISYTTGNKIKEIKNNNIPLEISYGKNTIWLKSGEKSVNIDFNPSRTKFDYVNKDEKLSYFFDEVGRLEKFVSSGLKVERKYDNRNNITQEVTNDDQFEYSYDKEYNILYKIMKNGKVISQRTIERGLVTSEERQGYGLINFTYDNLGNPTSVDIEGIGAIKLLRNSSGLIEEIQYPDKRKTQFKWKGNSLVKWIDANGAVGKFIKDNNESLEEVILPEGISLYPKIDHPSATPILSNVSTDSSLQKVKVTDQLNTYQANIDNTPVTIHTDGLRRITKIQLKNKDIRQYDYDNKTGHLKKIYLENDQWAQVCTNSSGRVIDYITSSGDFGQIGFTNASNQVTKTVLEKDFRLYEYDTENRLTETSINTVLKTKFGYGPNKSKTIYSIQYTDGLKVTYQLSPTNFVDAISFAGKKPIQFDYPGENSVEVRFPNEIIQTEDYNEQNHLSALSVINPEGQTIRELTWYYKNGKLFTGSDDGQRINIKSNENSESYEIAGLDQRSYTFNDENNLISLKTAKKNIRYKFDGDHQTLGIINDKRNINVVSIPVKGRIQGHRLNFIEVNGEGRIIQDKESFIVPNVSSKLGANTVNIKGILTSGSNISTKLNFFLHPEASTIYQFDNDKLVWSIKDNSVDYYSYNFFGQLTKFKNRKDKSIEFKYLPDGKISSTTQDKKSTLFVYDPFGNLIEEISSTGTSLRKYIYDYQSNRLILYADGKNIYYVHTDPFGSVLGLSNSKGEMVNEYKYSSYGEWIVKKEKVKKFPIGFLGWYFDSLSSMYISKAGSFNPTNLIGFPTIYRSLISSRSVRVFNQNNYLKTKPKFYNFSNTALEMVAMPHELSFNYDFEWVNILNFVHPDIILLKNFLNHQNTSQSKK